MKKSQITAGNYYLANVSGNRVTVRVNNALEKGFEVTNLSTGRSLTFKTAQRFLREVPPPSPNIPVSGKPLNPESQEAVKNVVLSQPVLPGGVEENFHEYLDRVEPGSKVSEAPRAKSVAQSDKPRENTTPVSKNGIAGIRAKAKSRYSEDKPAGLAPHVIITARAGTGKTTTGMAALTYMRGGTPMLGENTPMVPSPQQKAVWDAFAQTPYVENETNIAMVAFNSAIAKELQRRVPKGVSAMTVHAMGRRAVMNAFRLREGSDAVTGWKVSDVIQKIAGKPRRDINRSFMSSVNSLVGLCKTNLVGEYDGERFEVHEEELREIADKFDVEVSKFWKWIKPMVNDVMTECANISDGGYIDYNDMVWLPIVRNLQCFKYDLLFVDEAQDLNRIQHELTMRCGRRLIYCGDDKQAIYGFTGADSRSLTTLRRRLDKTSQGCVGLPLTVTRRCGKSIVKEANRLVPDFEAHESNGEGEVKTLSYSTGDPKKDYRTYVQPGDMVLARVNAVLVSECFRFIAGGVKARIQGRKIGDQLIKILEEIDASTIEDLFKALPAWKKNRQDREAAKENPDENKMVNIADQHDCIVAIAEGAALMSDVLERINVMFSDNGDDDCVLLSSGHKAKGLEADNVFLINTNDAPIPHPAAKTEEAREQEYNLLYVMITRAKSSLTYVR